MRLRIVAVTLLFAVGGCAPPIGLAGTMGRPMDATPTGIVHVAAGSDTDGSTVADPLMPESVPAAPAAGAPPVPGPETPAAKPGAVQPRRPESDFPLPPPARPVNCRQIKCVALTFDDGPGAYTGPLLDILAGHRARATFFVVGRMVSGSGEGILRRMVAEGHELGNHTWSHPQLPTLSQTGIREELGRTQWIVKQVTGVTMVLMRPPYGLTDARVAAESRQLGLAQIMWDVDTLDWRDQDSVIVAQRGAEAEPGSVVLMHDIHPSTVQAVPRLLDRLAVKGFRFVTLSELYGGRPEPGRKYYGSP
jgi:peptidoglycan-N-acetylglucosamine deacetylase